MLNCWAILLEIWEHTSYTLNYPEIFWEYMAYMEYTLSEQRCLWCSSHGPVPSKVGILNVFDFPTITAACAAPSDVWLITAYGLLSTLLSRFSSFSKFYWRLKIFCWIFCGISNRSSAICCSVLTINDIRSSCCWSTDASLFSLAPLCNI